VKRASNEETRTQRESGGGGHPPVSRSSGEGEEERETILPSLSSLYITHPPLCDVVCQQVGTLSDERQLK
jgi:hypothetical protein